MIKWAGWLIVFYGAAHTVGALTVEGGAKFAGTWFSRQLWDEGFANMSPAMSAFWLTVNSFGPPLTLIGLVVLWLDRRRITPPPFIAWWFAVWTVIATVITGPAVQDLIILIASFLLIVGARRASPPSGAIAT